MLYIKQHRIKKQEVKGAMTAGALTSFMATVTEPIEFSFLFASPKLYIIHSFILV